MTPYDMVDFSRTAAAALFSLSNVVFYFESGYWDAASELKPLLHTWSLGVEEQFYIFWPALVIGLLSIRRTIAFGTSLVLISVLGAALCIWFTGIDQSAAFYLLPFRVFQFAVGALVIPITSTLQNRTEKNPYDFQAFAFWSGMLCIFISVSFLNSDTPFPGWAVLMPTIGAALVLFGGAGPGELQSPARVLMANPLSIWVGRVSYSMYLVHWPLIALFRYHYALEITFTDQLVLAVGTLLATCILHYGIEHRFYQRDAGEGRLSALSGNRFALRTMAVAGLLALIATSAWKGDGWAWRFPSLSLSADSIKEGREDRFRHSHDACYINNSLSNKNCNFDAKIQMLVLGNSVEIDGFNFIRAGFGDDTNLNIILFGNLNPCKDWREEFGRFLSSDEGCQKRLDALFDPARGARIDMVLYSASQPYAANKTRLLTMIKKLKSVNPKISIVTLGGYITTKRDCAYYINKANSTDACSLPENVRYFEGDPEGEPMFGQFKAIESHYIDRVDLLCKNRVLETCRTRAGNGIPAFYDRLHNSIEFAEMSGKMYAKKYPDLLYDLTDQ